MEMRVAVEALRTEASTWDAQSEQMAQARGAVDGLQLGLVEAGVFMPIVPAYHDLVTTLRARCDEGATAMRTVADTLIGVAGTYESTDEQNARQLKNLY